MHELLRGGHLMKTRTRRLLTLLLIAAMTMSLMVRHWR